MKGQQHKNVLDYEKRRHLLLSLAHRQNASNLRRFSDALSLISKVFGEYWVCVGIQNLEYQVLNISIQILFTQPCTSYTLTTLDFRHQTLDNINYIEIRHQTLDNIYYIDNRHWKLKNIYSDIRHQTLDYLYYIDNRHQTLDTRQHTKHRHQTLDIRYQTTYTTQTSDIWQHTLQTSDIRKCLHKDIRHLDNIHYIDNRQQTIYIHSHYIDIRHQTINTTQTLNNRQNTPPLHRHQTLDNKHYIDTKQQTKYTTTAQTLDIRQ